jgi:hypothetical protein
MGPLDHPPAAGLDRRRDPANGDLAGHSAFGQDLPAGLVVVAGINRFASTRPTRPSAAGSGNC